MFRGLAVVAIALAIPAGLHAAAPDGFREVAPGVLTVIPPDLSTDDTLQRGDILEITKGLADSAWTPKRDSVGGTLVERAKDRTYPRDIWCLEFAYKPPRHIDIDLPGRDLTMRRKRVLYLLYRVKNTGGRRSTAPADDPASALQQVTLTREVAQTPQSAEPFPAWHRAATALSADMDATPVDEKGVPVTLHDFDTIGRELAQLYRRLESRDLAAGSAAGSTTGSTMGSAAGLAAATAARWALPGSPPASVRV